ncbi:MAG TPA: MarR family transcriptional regulator [Acidimicrobiales bacterium]|jgi:DNA-binding MarR family transcriptional regulator
MAGTRWLSEDEQRTWRTFVQATRLLFDQLEHELDHQTEVPSPYYEILAPLAEAPERRLRMSDLADLSQSSRSRLSHSMARLESVGWIRREASQMDRRGAFAVLTEEGFSAIEAAAPVHAEGVRTHLFDQLDAEQLEELRRISERVLEHLMAVKGSPPEQLGLRGIFAPGVSSHAEGREPVTS